MKKLPTSRRRSVLSTERDPTVLPELEWGTLSHFVPEEIKASFGGDIQSAFPAIAKNRTQMNLIENAIHQIPTEHRFVRQDATQFRLPPNSVHLVLTSPPYWTLKEYRDHEHQLGHVSDYEQFLNKLDSVWSACYEALVTGGRLVCVVGDVCLSRRKNNGRHTVVPLHAAIQERCRKIGFDNLAPIIWHKIANASYEAENGTTFLGKPYEPNAVIKNDIEFILMQRKSGGYRAPDLSARVLSLIRTEDHKEWFQQIWTGLTGASTRNHPAPYPLELANRLVKMFSFAGDTVLDPFMGTATTNVAAAHAGRNSIGVEVDPHYFEIAAKRMTAEASTLFAKLKCETDQQTAA
jgi:DNA modification methylase